MTDIVAFTEEDSSDGEEIVLEGKAHELFKDPPKEVEGAF